MFFKRFFMLFFIVTFLFSLSGCSKKQSDDDVKKEKVDQEISYLDSKIVTMMNGLNSISFNNYTVVSEDVNKQQSENTNRK